MFGLYGKMTAHPGQGDALIQLLLAAAKSLRDTEGCYLYVVNRVTSDPDAIWIYEAWRSQADHQASLTNEAVKALIASARPLIAGMSDRMELVPLGGKGIPEEDQQ
jgi:quinol monooxygenase YgiN